MDYCLLTNFPYAIPLEYEGVKLFDEHEYVSADGKPRFYASTIPGVWRESFALERTRRDQRAQADLDEEWAWWDAAAEGHELAQLRVKMSGKKPTSRTIEPSTLGLGTRHIITGEPEPYALNFTKTAVCHTCGCLMLVSDKRHIHCSPACADVTRKARIKRGSDRRQKTPLHQKTCIACQEPFQSKRDDAMYCSPKCRVKSNRRNKALAEETANLEGWASREWMGLNNQN